jgi:hypothetical protein
VSNISLSEAMKLAWSNEAFKEKQLAAIRAGVAKRKAAGLPFGRQKKKVEPVGTVASPTTEKETA